MNMEQVNSYSNNLPQISFAKNQIKVSTVYKGIAINTGSSGMADDTRSVIASVAAHIPSDVIWSQAMLLIRDSIYNGCSRGVLVEFAQDSEYTFIKSVNPLFKSEFEDVFGFESGEFIKGRIIRLLSEYINIAKEVS